jgi:uncharacterized protein involved in propanediol utilization
MNADVHRTPIECQYTMNGLKSRKKEKDKVTSSRRRKVCAKIGSKWNTMEFKQDRGGKIAIKSSSP